MADVTCAHCNVRIGDHSTMVEREGQTFCCNNCAQMAGGQPLASGGQVAQMGGTVCAHCQMGIADTSTQVTRGTQTFCCINCANAMAAGTGSGAAPGSARDH